MFPFNPLEIIILTVSGGLSKSEDGWLFPFNPLRGDLDHGKIRRPVTGKGEEVKESVTPNLPFAQRDDMDHIHQNGEMGVTHENQNPLSVGNTNSVHASHGSDTE